MSKSNILTMFRFIVKQGDAFNNDDITTPIAHFIANDAGMGAGIARTIADAVGSGIRGHCRGAGIGSVVLYYKKGFKPILNMISKEVSYHKPKMEDSLLTLLNLKKFLVDNNIKKLHIPFIGAGLDGLPWFKIEEFILKNFCDLDIEITAFFFDKKELDRIIDNSNVIDNSDRVDLYRETFIAGDEGLVFEKELGTGKQ